MFFRSTQVGAWLVCSLQVASQSKFAFPLMTIPKPFANAKVVLVLQLSDWTATQLYRIVQLLGDSGKLFRRLFRGVLLTCYRYQMLDAFAGLFYTFFTTLAILYGLQAVRSIFKRRWTPVFRDANRNRRWKLEATPQHAWRETT